MVYTAESQSLAALEIVVHLDSSELLARYVLIEVGIDERLMAHWDHRLLHKNWRAKPSKSREIGDAWVAAGSSVVLEVPSATIPAEKNFLINPRHPDFLRLHLGKPFPFQFDPRLTELGR